MEKTKCCSNLTVSFFLLFYCLLDTKEQLYKNYISHIHSYIYLLILITSKVKSKAH